MFSILDDSIPFLFYMTNSTDIDLVETELTMI